MRKEKELELFEKKLAEYGKSRNTYNVKRDKDTGILIASSKDGDPSKTKWLAEFKASENGFTDHFLISSYFPR